MYFVKNQVNQIEKRTMQIKGQRSIQSSIDKHVHCKSLHLGSAQITVPIDRRSDGSSRPLNISSLGTHRTTAVFLFAKKENRWNIPFPQPENSVIAFNWHPLGSMAVLSMPSSRRLILY